MVLRNVVEANEEKPLFQLFFLKNDENQSVGVVEVEEIDFTEVKKHIEQGESVFITHKREKKLNSNLIASEEATQEVPRGQGETVLLVEDEPLVLEVGQAMLERVGYRVLTATDGQKALEVYGQHQAEIALVLADIVMPNMGGVALFHVLKAQNPDIRVVLITGYPLGEEAQNVLDLGIVDWLEKPMTTARLAQVVSRALGR